MFRLKSIVLAVSIAFSVQAVAQEQKEAAVPVANVSPLVVKIAHVSPLTGPQAESGKEALNGAKMAIEDANKLGLSVSGRPVVFELVIKDDRGNRQDASTIANSLVAQGDIVAVVGHLSSGTTVAASTVYSANNVIQVSPAATSPLYTKQGGNMTFRTITSDERQGAALAEYVVKTMKAKNVVLVSENNLYADGIASKFESSVRSLGGSIRTRLNTNGKEMEVLYHLADIKKAKPDAIVFAGMDVTAANYTIAIRRAGLQMPIVVTDGGCSDEFLMTVGDDSQYFCSRNGRPVEEMALWPAFADRYRQTYGSPAKPYSAYAYDAVKSVVFGIKDSGSVSAGTVAAQMHKGRIFGISGSFSFDKKGDVANGPVSIYAAQNGGWVFETSLPSIDQKNAQVADEVVEQVTKTVPATRPAPIVTEPEIKRPTTQPAESMKPMETPQARTPAIQVLAEKVAQEKQEPVQPKKVVELKPIVPAPEKQETASPLKMDANFDSYKGLVQFAGGAARLGPIGKKEIAEISVLAKEAESVRLKGHVGRIQLTEEDRKLAVGRSIAVKTELVMNGVEKGKIRILNPSDNDLIDQKRLSPTNRSVEIRLQMPDGQTLAPKKVAMIEGETVTE